MKLELNIPKLQIPEFRQPINPFGNESLRALVIVIGTIIVISGAVYSAQLVKRQKSTVLPAQTEVEVSPPIRRVSPQPTATAVPTATLTPVPTREVIEIPEIPTATTSPTLTY